MKPILKWTLIIGGVGVTGAVAYFIWKKMKEKSDENKSNNNISNSASSSSASSSSASSSSASSSSAIKCKESYPSTPFSSKAEGDAFRKWVNKYNSKYAKEIDLALSGEYNNCYIKEAYDKYGKLYSFALLPTYLGGVGGKFNSVKDRFRVDYVSKGAYTEFDKGGRYAIKTIKNRLPIDRGSYQLGGKIMKSDGKNFDRL